MRVAVIGSRGLTVDNMEMYLPQNISEIVSGGAKGVDTSAKAYAIEKGIKLTEFLPDYKQYGKSAPLKRNVEIINYADMVIAFWDGALRGTKFVIEKCMEINKPLTIYKFDEKQNIFVKHKICNS